MTSTQTRAGTQSAPNGAAVDLPWGDGIATPWIGGRFAPADGETVEDRNPATGEVFAHVRLATENDVEAAVEVAVAAQRTWGRLPIRERADRVDRLADRLLERAEAIGRLDSRDTGSPLAAMQASGRKGALYLKQLAGVALELQGRTVPASGAGWHVVKPEPWGVIAAITAYNHPTLYACLKAGPALIAGNAVVIKPSEQAPLSTLALAALTEDLLPSGLLSVLPAQARSSAALVPHRAVARVSFTGSVATAVRIQAAIAAAGRIKSVAFELGGKNPIVVFSDADLDEAAAATVRGMSYTRVQGQSCGSTSRLLAPADLVAPLTERILELVGRIRVGLPERPGTEMGSLISLDHRDRVMGFVERAVAAGASLLAGGAPPDDAELANGAFMLPTVLGDVEPTSEVAREEVYGPVLAILAHHGEAHAIQLANATDYGLTASIWTRDLDRALRTADALDAGYVWVNDVETRHAGVPFGGWGQSGLGTEQGLLGDLAQCTRPKAVNVAVRH